ncbi:MAG: GDSL-type esterase/lipase family protein [Actinobacteria bacterium]|nr:GDSL-type esterase/lipase family protein [Actinomycetota bacterium]
MSDRRRALASRARRGLVALGVLAGMLLLAAGTPTPGLAGPGSGPPAVVAMGDSYISGEAGRWRGNSIDLLPGNDATDRACIPGALLCLADKSRVYVGGSAADGCHRSDVSEVMSARLAGAQPVNIACSGAVSANIPRAQTGGVGQNGEAPQADQLLPIARTRDVRAIVLSIGGNDLGFTGIVTACLEAYLLHQGPRAAETRYPEGDPRRVIDGCPFYDHDLDWARDVAAPEIGAVVRAAARARGVEVLELRDALAGHEICAGADREATLLHRPTPARSEWGRFVGVNTILEGDLQEAFHPNAYAQRALGTCLGRVLAAAPGGFACSGGPGRAPAEMRVVRG